MNTRPDERNQPEKTPVSPRKREANHRNALKSTGPKSSRGKKHSSMNSLMHGLYAKALFKDFVVQREDPKEFQKWLTRHRNHYQPVGMAEELEVEHKAVCEWRLSRAWRFENAEIHVAQTKIAIQAQYSTIMEIMIPEHRALVSVLENAKKEILAGATISLDLKQRIFAADSSFRELWPWLQKQGEKCGRLWYQESISRLGHECGIPLSRARRYLDREPEWQAERNSVVALAVIKLVIKHIEVWTERNYEMALSPIYEREAIPSREALDRLLRYRAAIRKELAQATDRLEYLQRRRKGEPVPPTLSMRLTQ